MGTRHDGVSCDACMKNSFRLRRYKCLICYDYDLCGSCYDGGRETNNHSTSHPMQCLLTKADYDIFYSGESYSSESVFSYTCPLCNRLGFSESGLIEHVTSEHPTGELEVICPICASHQEGQPNRQTFELARHLSLDHRTPLDSQTGHGDDSGGGDSSGGGHPTGHLRHLRRAGRPTANSSFAGAGGGQSGSSSSSAALTGSRLGRRNLSSFAAALAGAGGHAGVANGSNSVDPIADLLTQLNSVRSRAAAASVSNQLAQIELQLQSTRAQLEQAMPATNRRSGRSVVSMTPGAGSVGSLEHLVYLSGGDALQNSSSGVKPVPESDPIPVDCLPERSEGIILEEAAAALVDCQLSDEFSKGQGFLHKIFREEERQDISPEELYNRTGFLQELLLASLMYKS